MHKSITIMPKTIHSNPKIRQILVIDRRKKRTADKRYILHLVNRNASTSWINMTFSAFRNFYEMNDVDDIKWKKLKRFTGEEIPHNEDRCYTHEEIHTIVNS